MRIKYIAVTLTSSLDVNKKYINLTREVAKVLSKEGYGIIYGGTNYGMMSALAESYLANGGKELIGVMSKELIGVTKKYRFHKKLTKRFLMSTMESRKKKIMDLADAFIIIPGGYGTFEEMGSIVGSKVNKLLDKPIAILNYNGFYDSLLSFLSSLYKKKFSKIPYKDIVFVSDDIQKIVGYFKKYTKKRIPDKFVK